MSSATESIKPKEKEAANESTRLVSTTVEDKEETSISSRCSVIHVIGLIFAAALVLVFAVDSVLQIKLFVAQDELEYHKFPEDFVWGAATSSYQIEGATQEGGRGVSIWDTYCMEQGKIADGSNGDVACDHYHRMEEDVKLMKKLGLKAYRFSIAWPRILPEGQTSGGKDGVNSEGVDFYNRLIDELLKNDIEPWVTLYHWDLPQALEDEYGGWLSPEIIDDFGRYASVCFEAFGDRVKNWITLNESWTVAVQAYEDGTKAPGRSVNPEVEVYLVAHHLMLAHARAARIYRERFLPIQGGKIGISNCGDFRYPLNPESLEDQDAAERAMVFQYAWLTDPLIFGDYPDEMRIRLGDRLPRFTDAQRLEMVGSLDFMGLNHYSTLYASAKTKRSFYRGYWADMDVDFSSDPSWRKNIMVSAVIDVIYPLSCVCEFWPVHIWRFQFAIQYTCMLILKSPLLLKGLEHESRWLQRIVALDIEAI